MRKGKGGRGAVHGTAGTRIMWVDKPPRESSLPQYKKSTEGKVKSLSALAVGKWEGVNGASQKHHLSFCFV